MAWILVIVAGLFEIGMAVFLKQSEGFSRLSASLAFAGCSVLSFGLLAAALRDLPVGTAYAVWTGIGAAGTAILGMAVLGESAGFLRVASIALIVAGVIGLKVAT
ncbi:MAG: QacE family quaternary ammonium compound efflux SMR transporter [Frankiales bacterium]|nr:QacE family quaternary ammonium compound efflux SMR transporter [Frankiales bacterium]